MRQEGERRDDRVVVQSISMPLFRGDGKLRPGLNRGRRDELEQERRLADDDLTARLFVEGDLVRADLSDLDPLGLSAQRRKSLMPVFRAMRPLIPSRKFRQ